MPCTGQGSSSASNPTWQLVGTTISSVSISSAASETSEHRERSRSRDPASYDDKDLSAQQVRETIRRAETQIEANSSRMKCCNCWEPKLKSALLPLFRCDQPQTGTHIRVFCFECAQCEHEDHPWQWTEDTLDGMHCDWRNNPEIMQRLAAHEQRAAGSAGATPYTPTGPAEMVPYVPLQTPSFHENPLMKEVPIKQLHEKQRDGTYTRKPMYSEGSNAANLAKFKRDAKRGWIQFAITNKGHFESCARDMDYKKLKARLEVEQPGISKKELRLAIVSLTQSFAETFATVMFSGPKSAQQLRAFQNFQDNLEGLGNDLNFKIMAINKTFEGNRFSEYIDQITQGVNQHFICRIQSCRSCMPSDCWFQGYKPSTGGTPLLPNLWQFRCPMCFWHYTTSSSKGGWDAMPLVPAHKIMAFKDFHQDAPVFSRDNAHSLIETIPDRLGETASGEHRSEMDIRLEKVCMQRDGYEFFLTEWEDKITGVLLDDLKAKWHEVQDRCEGSTNPKTVQEISIQIAATLRNQAYFRDIKVPIANMVTLRSHNAAKPQPTILWSCEMLPKHEDGTLVVPLMTYEYDTSKHVLTVRDQCRLWTTTSYVINYMMLAQTEIDARGGAAQVAAENDSRVAADARATAQAQRR